MKKTITSAQHTVICEYADSFLLGYFGWPTVAKPTDGTLVVAASGFRKRHVCPFGKSVLFRSEDGGNTWSQPEIVADTLIDNRDGGVTALEDNKFLVSFFSSDTRIYDIDEPVLALWDDDEAKRATGAFVRRYTPCEGGWGGLLRTPVSSPHGPVRLKSGKLLYVGTYFPGDMEIFKLNIVKVYESDDEGESWRYLADIPAPEEGEYCEPTVLDRQDGTLVVHMRHQAMGKGLSIWQTISVDGGKSWSEPEFVTSGAPPHLLRHSSGVWIGSYGWRDAGFGQRVMLSSDEGRNWDVNWILRDDGPDIDLGYPSTVELADGTLFTVYYQKPGIGRNNCGLYGTHWVLP